MPTQLMLCFDCSRHSYPPRCHVCGQDLIKARRKRDRALKKVEVALEAVLDLYRSRAEAPAAPSRRARARRATPGSGPKGR